MKILYLQFGFYVNDLLNCLPLQWIRKVEGVDGPAIATLEVNIDFLASRSSLAIIIFCPLLMMGQQIFGVQWDGSQFWYYRLPIHIITVSRIIAF